jgi:hypothetical protein
MTAIILPFPNIRRRTFIRNQAERLTCMNARGAERYLDYQLRVQADAMRRRGIADNIIALELASIELAIRSEFFQTVWQA